MYKLLQLKKERDSQQKRINEMIKVCSKCTSSKKCSMYLFDIKCVPFSPIVPSNEPHLRCSKNNIPKARMRTLKMSIVIVICFIVCWTPYYLLGLWYWFFPDDLEGKVSHSLTHILFIFGLFNACLDPIIYGLFTIRFQKGLRNCYRKAAVMSSLETNAVIMESLKCTGSVLPSKRGMTSGEKDFSSEQAEAKSTDNSIWQCLVAGRGATLAFHCLGCLFTELIGFYNYNMHV